MRLARWRQTVLALIFSATQLSYMARHQCVILGASTGKCRVDDQRCFTPKGTFEPNIGEITIRKKHTTQLKTLTRQTAGETSEISSCDLRPSDLRCTHVQYICRKREPPRQPSQSE
jgi:hypothetical protein